MTMRIRSLLALAVALTGAGASFAQPPAPPPPAKYNATVRYYIPAPRDQHVMQYDSMIRFLKQLGFEFNPPLDKHAATDREDRSKNYIEGSIASAKARKLLDHPAVHNVLLVPDGFDLPKEPDAPVLVRLELAGNLSAEQQRELANQTRVLLREFGFKEPVGYDHRTLTVKGPGRYYTRIVGTIPRVKLDLLQRDLRGHPGGWVGPVIKRDELPMPLRAVNPVQVIEVLPDTEEIKELVEPTPRLPDFADKISADLWAEIVKDKDIVPASLRVQIAFVGAISPDGRDWRRTISDLAPGFVIEGQLGQFVTGVMPLDQVKALASAPNISTIRMPRVPSVNVDPAIHPKGDDKSALAQTGLAVFHEVGFKGQGVRIGIIDRDFRGWETLVNNQQLPWSGLFRPRGKTRLVDLTTESDPDIYPQKYPDDKVVFGHGTLCAQAAAIAAPHAEIVLIRVDLADPQQLAEIVRYVEGGRFSNSIERRNGELVAKAAHLTARRGDLLKERRAILEDFTDESDARTEMLKDFLGPLFMWLYSDREWHRQRMAHLEELEAKHLLHEIRFRDFLEEVNSLKGIPILVNAVSFHHGYPLGSTSPLSKVLDDPVRRPLWFQAVGNVRNQTWSGLFRHVTGDPAMKFAEESVALPPGRWSRELNYLHWHPYAGKPINDLPEKATLRITMQWREPHDPDYYLPGAEGVDPYRRPLADMRLHLIRQRDSESKTLPADLFEIVARTTGLPERLEHLPTGSTYEQVLAVPLDKAGRYAIRVDKRTDTQWVMSPHPERRTPSFERLKGLAPTGVRPLGVPTLPALEKTAELRPRIFVEVIDEVSRLQGRPVFADFASDAGSITSPADAGNVISVGAASLKNLPQPYSAFGSPLHMEMAGRPRVYMYDELELAGGGAFGTSVANAFAAGAAATLQSAGATRPQVLLWLRSHDGQVLRVPVAKK